MPTQKKIDTVARLVEKISRAKSLVLVNYRGLKHKQMEELRKALAKTEADFVVAKNRLMLRALGDKAELLKDGLVDTTATLFSYADEGAPLKELLKFFKAAGTGKTKAGLLGTQVLSDAEVTRLAGLPGRDVLLAQLVGQLNGPIQGFHYALNWNLQRLVFALNQISKSKGGV